MQLVYAFMFRNSEATYVIMLTCIKYSCVFTTHIYGKHHLCIPLIIVRCLQKENIMVYPTLLESEFIE